MREISKPIIMRKFSLAIGELVSFCKIVRDNVTRDLTTFKNYKPKYVQAFLDALNLRIADLTNLVENKIKIGEEKQMTEEIYAEVNSLRPLLNKYEGYVEDAAKAAPLSVPVTSFRFKEVRKEVGTKDMEQLIIEVQTNWQMIDDNLDAIKHEGYTDDLHTAYHDLIADIDSRNALRVQKMEEKESIVLQNIDFLNGMYADCMDICNDGKRIYKFTDKDKLKDYTMTAIRRKITQLPASDSKALKTDAYITGRITDFETENPIANAKVWTNDNLKGVLTDANGVYKIKVYSKTVKMLYAQAEGYNKYEEDVELDPKVNMVMDIELEKPEVVAPDAPPVA